MNWDAGVNKVSIATFPTSVKLKFSSKIVKKIENQSLPGNKPEQYFATRNMIWEIVMGYRDSTHPYTRRDARCYNAFSGHAGFVQTYKELEKKLTTHYLRPSFPDDLQ